MMTLKLLLIILGAMLIVEALPLFISPVRMKEYYRRISEVDPGTLRVIAFLMIITGILIVYSLKGGIC